MMLASSHLSIAVFLGDDDESLPLSSEMFSVVACHRKKEKKK
jgi:hypothetical protein